MHLKCADAPPHHHEAIQGTLHGEKMTAYTEPYCSGICARYAQLVKAGYDRGAKAVALAIKRPPLKDVTVLWKPEESPEAVIQRPVYAGGSSGSGKIAAASAAAVSGKTVAAASGSASAASSRPIAGGGSTAIETMEDQSEALVPPAPPARVAPTLPEEIGDGTGIAAPAQDYWIETANSYIRYHVCPRRTLFHPGSVAEATDEADKALFPDLMSLKAVRYTTYSWTGATVLKVLKDKWTEVATASRSLSKEWTGRTVFAKLKPAAPTPEHPDGIPVDGNPISTIVASLGSLRKEIASAQRQDPELNDIIRYLEKQPLGSITHAKHLKSSLVKRAEYFKLASDGVLIAKLEDELAELPVVPNVRYCGESGAEDRPKNMTWKHLLLSAVHLTPTGPHLRPAEMVNELRECLFWNPPEKLRHDCELWTSRCKSCVSLFKRPLGDPPSKAVTEFRPFYRIQIDLMEIRPTGETGETHILTCSCVATRYVFLRCCMGREHHEIAERLFDVVLDMGVVPKLIQSDLEFASQILNEFTVLLGSNQMFSTALRPQSQGITERSHKEMRATLSMFVETLVRAHPRRWPRLIRIAESKIRQKTLLDVEGIRVTPYSAVHGFAGSSALRSAVDAVGDVPNALVTNAWLSTIIQQSQHVVSLYADKKQADADQAQREQTAIRTQSVKEGELVLLRKPFYERGNGLILPQADGPYRVHRVFGSHSVQLAELTTGVLLMNGKAVATSRLVRFAYPAEIAVEDLRPELAETSFSLGDYLVFETQLSGRPRTTVGKILRVHAVGSQLEVQRFEVPEHERFGPWLRRPWTPADLAPEMISFQEVIAKVDMTDGVLTTDDLSALEHQGVAATASGREKLLPGRSTLPE